jgi:Ca-activated chloride channel family protein
MDVEQFNGRSWQQDALDYTRAFRAKFPAWARAYEQQAQSDTNKPPFTAEDQAKISALATELEKLQMECVEKSLPPSQEEAVRIINEIRELLPKNQNGGGQSQQNQDQQQKNDQNQQQNQQNQDQQQQQQDQQQQNQDQQQSEGEDDKNKDEPDEGDQQDTEDQEVEAVLKKAQERSDEHEAEKKARMRKAPLPPNERDW